jgi:hypothetical protein
MLQGRGNNLFSRQITMGSSVKGNSVKGNSLKGIITNGNNMAGIKHGGQTIRCSYLLKKYSNVAQ